MKNRLWQILFLVTAFLLMAAVAINRDGRIFGIDLHPAVEVADPEVMTVDPMGIIKVNTTTLAPKAIGYAGATPLEISVKDGIVTEITPLPNAETPSFFERAVEGVLPQYKGHSVEEALALNGDAVTGATFSSDALKQNVSAGLQYVQTEGAELMTRKGSSFSFSWRWLCALIVALCAAILPLFVHSKVYRLVQQIANVCVLGFWSGTFLSYALMVGFLANGLEILSALVPVVMLLTAFIYPLFGHPNHYCTWICPLGSLQDLASSLTRKKVKMGQKALKWLRIFRVLLWCALMFIMWIGVGFVWMDYEPFSAFVVESASWIVITIAALFVVLSLIVPRPYCRFVCPTGSLFKISTSKPENK